MDGQLLDVRISVRSCTIDQSNHPLITKFVSRDYKDGVIVKDIAGIVIKVGEEVTRFKEGDEVIAVLPVNQYFDIKSGICDLPEYFIVHKPSTLSWEVASCCLSDGIKAFDALHYLGRVRSGDSLLLCNAASSFGVLATQLASNWGVKVFLTTSDEETGQMLRTMSLDVERTLIGHQFVMNSVMDETGGLGVSCIVDNGVLPNHQNMEENEWKKPTKHDVLSCLAVSGRWVTMQHDLQLDPPDSEILHLKNASVCHLFPDALVLSCLHQDKLLHIMAAVMEKAAAGILRPHLMSVLPSSEVSPTLFPTMNRIVLKL
nr:quinone oxidoreductase-like protein 1 [Ciona intestinalis]|eukprot:XP_009857748.1 quinone oxidoreductase-like protein 1 [Ciona intestinalis]